MVSWRFNCVVGDIGYRLALFSFCTKGGILSITFGDGVLSLAGQHGRLLSGWFGGFILDYT